MSQGGNGAIDAVFKQRGNKFCQEAGFIHVASKFFKMVQIESCLRSMAVAQVARQASDVSRGLLVGDNRRSEPRCHVRCEQMTLEVRTCGQSMFVEIRN